MLYTCVKCKKPYNKKSNYLAHINRKRPCENDINFSSSIISSIKNYNGKNTVKSGFLSVKTGENTVFNNINKNITLEDKTCNYCNKIFKRKDYLTEHINKNRCKLKKLLDVENNNKDKLIELLLQEKEENKKQNEMLRKEIEDLKIVIIESQNKRSNIMNHSNIASNNRTTNNITVKFGNEDINLLSKEEKLQICKYGLNAANCLIEKLHFNPKLPQYHNVYISDKKFNHALVYNGNEFRINNVDKTLEILLNKSSMHLEDFIETLELDDKTIIKLEKLIDIIQSSTDEEFIKKKKHEIKMLLYNNKNVVLKNTEFIKNKLIDN